MKITIAILLLLVLSASADAKDRISDSVVKVYSTLREPQATEDILADEGIRKQFSDDLENVWRKAK